MARLGVCSWSLRPTSPDDLAQRARELELNWVQLALDPIRRGEWSVDATRKALADAGVEIASGMVAFESEDYSTLESIRVTGGVRPDGAWSKNRRAADQCARIAHELGLTLVTFHAGFVPHDRADPVRLTMLERLEEMLGMFDSRHITLAFETGQETAETLVTVLQDLDKLYSARKAMVNFDPANMILYGSGKPVPALRRLADRVAQVHIKDADPSPAPGHWGEEMVVGAGSVPWPEFFSTLREVRPDAPMMCEREAGDDRVGDLREAIEMVRLYRGEEVTR